jgi:hypothetical protein
MHIQFWWGSLLEAASWKTDKETEDNIKMNHWEVGFKRMEVDETG